MKTFRSKLTEEPAKLLARASREEGFLSKSEFVRYALARALEGKLSVKTIEEIFEARHQIRAGRTVSLNRPESED